MKLVEVILRRMGRREKNGMDEPSWSILDIYVWKCYNETPCISIIY